MIEAQANKNEILHHLRLGYERTFVTIKLKYN